MFLYYFNEHFLLIIYTLFKGHGGLYNDRFLFSLLYYSFLILRIMVVSNSNSVFYLASALNHEFRCPLPAG